MSGQTPRGGAWRAAEWGDLIVVGAGAFFAGRVLDHPAWAAGTLAAVLAVAIAASWCRGRQAAAELRRVEAHARTLLERDWRSAPEATPASLGARSGAFATVHALLSDLGERLSSQLEEVARKSRNLESLIGALDEPVLATDSQDRIFLSNRAAEAMLDASADGLIGRPLRDVITHEAVRDLHAQARRGGPRRGRIQLTTPEGQRTFQVSASPVPAARGDGVFGVVLLLRDITELDKAMQVKSDFVANASHELRTPVAAIKGAAETLAVLGPEEREQSARLVEMIEGHASRLEEMLRDLMDLSRLESDGVALALAPVSLAELADSLRSLFDDVCRERSITLSFELAPELDGFATDRRLLLLALRNLVDNACRFSPEGGTVRIVARLIDEEPALARFEVSDTGSGIPLEHQARVFERYYQVEPARSGGRGARRGTGLGLSIVKHAARALGGSVGLTSVWGQGTTVWVEIPTASAD